MKTLTNNEPLDQRNDWRTQLDKFVRDNQPELAALAWGLNLEKGESNDTLGINVTPTPHFVYCSREAIDKLNRQVEGKINEILGIINGYKPEEEVLAIAIGQHQIKLVYFKPEIPPPDCFEKAGEDVDSLLRKLEERMAEKIKLED
ncbi:MAG: hypothetical protein SXA11_16000 [Cyanobacteriota bacterium]|nr:hypothetical protein [Cyanobacteriota bacterium]